MFRVIEWSVGLPYNITPSAIHATFSPHLIIQLRQTILKDFLLYTLVSQHPHSFFNMYTFIPVVALAALAQAKPFNMLQARKMTTITAPVAGYNATMWLTSWMPASTVTVTQAAQTITASASTVTLPASTLTTEVDLSFTTTATYNFSTTSYTTETSTTTFTPAPLTTTETSTVTLDPVTVVETTTSIPDALTTTEFSTATVTANASTLVVTQTVFPTFPTPPANASIVYDIQTSTIFCDVTVVSSQTLYETCTMVRQEALSEDIQT